VNKQPKQLMVTAWKPGQSGNPAGRPLGARQRISEKLLADLADVWEVNGKAVLESLVTEDPGKLAQIAYGLLPRDIFVRVEDQRGANGLGVDEWSKLRRLLDLIEASCPEGTEPDAVFDTIEHALRSEFAKQIEG
jgi:hypothetical protein